MTAWRRLARVAVPLGVVWLGLNGRDLASWLIGVPAVLAASVLVGAIPGGRPLALRWGGLFRFALYFVTQSVSGGWDVARRVVRRRMRIDPGYIVHDTSLPPGAARQFFVGVISLLPGTLTADVEGDRIIVHTIDVDAGPETALRELESQVARIFAGTRRDTA